MTVARWASLASLVLVLLVTWWQLDGAGVGPGPLHPAHRALPALAGGASCTACHVVGGGVDAAGCIACHHPIGEQIERGAGLHGALGARRARDCAACHGEHHDDATPLIAPHAFRRAGFGREATFAHGHVTFELTGAHDALSCEACHAGAGAAEPPAGGRFIGLSQRCASCHDDPHAGAFGARCADCHGQEKPWSLASRFRHDGLPLANAHQSVACAQCHPATGSRSVAALTDAPQPARGCADCHDDPHGGGTLTTSLRLAATSDCRRCHDDKGWRGARVTPAEHAALGFALRGAHAQANCAACHGGPAVAPAWTEGGVPAVADCARCHEHPHSVELVAAAVARRGPSTGCGGCHESDDEAFSAGTMPAPLHAAIGFPLTAPHGDVACGQCHGGADRAERFPGRAPADCRACHGDAHDGQFDSAPRRHGQCTDCHLPTAFHPARFDASMHAKTAFPLTGAHDAVACRSCHRQAAGEARRFRGTPRACEDCHSDVHAGRFDGPGLPRRVAGETGCARCHDTRAFAPTKRAFDHALWTGHELTGRHAGLECGACHPPRDRGAAGGRLGPAPGARCADCHADPHAGQFGEGGPTDCRRCHDTATFGIRRFDHDETRFRLDAVHRELACASCHRAHESSHGPVIRYRPLGTACGDCHRLGGGDRPSEAGRGR